MKLTFDATTKDFLKPYMIPLVGEYNSGVFECPHCGKNILGNFYVYVIGFDNITFEMQSVLRDLAINAKEITFSSVYSKFRTVFPLFADL